MRGDYRAFFVKCERLVRAFQRYKYICVICLFSFEQVQIIAPAQQNKLGNVFDKIAEQYIYLARSLPLEALIEPEFVEAFVRKGRNESMNISSW